VPTRERLRWPNDRAETGSGLLASGFVDSARPAFEMLERGLRAALGDRGVEFVAPPKKEPWGTSVIFKDSEQNQLHLGSR
jgi:hypothetical protein